MRYAEVLRESELVEVAAVLPAVGARAVLRGAGIMAKQAVQRTAGRVRTLATTPAKELKDKAKRKLLSAAKTGGKVTLGSTIAGGIAGSATASRGRKVEGAAKGAAFGAVGGPVGLAFGARTALGGAIGGGLAGLGVATNPTPDIVERARFRRTQVPKS